MMEILSVRNPQATKDGGVDLEIEHSVYGWVPFHAVENDSEAHGRELYQRAMAGDFGPVSPYFEPELTLAQIALEKMAALQAEKVRIRDGGVVVDGTLFDTDESAMSAYTRTMLFLFSQNPTASIANWKASTGAWVTMTLPLLSSLVPVIAANETAAFAWQSARESEVNAAVADDNRAVLVAVSTTYSL